MNNSQHSQIINNKSATKNEIKDISEIKVNLNTELKNVSMSNIENKNKIESEEIKVETEPKAKNNKLPPKPNTSKTNIKDKNNLAVSNNSSNCDFSAVRGEDGKILKEDKNIKLPESEMKNSYRISKEVKFLESVNTDLENQKKTNLIVFDNTDYERVKESEVKKIASHRNKVIKKQEVTEKKYLTNRDIKNIELNQSSDSLLDDKNIYIDLNNQQIVDSIANKQEDVKNKDNKQIENAENINKLYNFNLGLLIL